MTHHRDVALLGNIPDIPCETRLAIARHAHSEAKETYGTAHKLLPVRIEGQNHAEAYKGRQH